MPIEALSGYVTYPGRLLGVHWMNPAAFVPCVAVIPSSQTALPAIEFSKKLIHGLGKVAVRVSDQAGFVANRLQYALFHEATRMVEESLAPPRQIDQVVRNSFGFRLPFFGPFATADMAGLDIYIGSHESLAAGYGERFAAPQLLTERIANAYLGLKTGGGFTGMDRERIEEIVRCRNRACVLVQKLREELGPAPGWASEIQQR